MNGDELEIEILSENAELLRQVLAEMRDSAYGGCALTFLSAVVIGVSAWQEKNGFWQYAPWAIAITAGVAHYLSSRLQFHRIAKRRNEIIKQIRRIDPDRYILSEESRWGRA